MQPAAAVRRLLLVSGGASAPASAASALAAARRHFCSSTQPGDGEAFLSSLTNHEAFGVASGAGLPASPAAFTTRGVRAALAALGDPQRTLRVVHVVGTKGKGSTAAMLSSVMRAAGYRVGTYTSPHLGHLGERVQGPQGGGAPLTPAALDAAAARLARALAPQQQQEGAGPSALVSVSHFEAVTALALAHFAEASAQLAVVEAGLGGATDATNVFEPEQLEAAVVTPLGLEHVDALGGNLASIAAAKAGVLRAGRPIIIAAQPHAEAAAALLAAAAAARAAPVVRADELVAVTASGGVEAAPGATPQGVSQRVDIVAAAGDEKPLELRGVRLPLVGAHQRANLQAVVAAVLQLRRQGWEVPDAALVEGLEAAQLPGRFQVLPLNPDDDEEDGTDGHRSSVNAQQQRHRHVAVVDGAHTADAGAALAATLRDAFPSAPLALVLAMADDKDHRGFVTALRAAAPRVAVFTSVAIAGGAARAAPPGTLAAHWQAAAMLDTRRAGRPRCRELIQAGMAAAVEKARQELDRFGEPGVVCVAGSLHGAAAALRALQR